MEREATTKSGYKLQAASYKKKQAVPAEATHFYLRLVAWQAPPLQ